MERYELGSIDNKKSDVDYINGDSEYLKKSLDKMEDQKIDEGRSGLQNMTKDSNTYGNKLNYYNNIEYLDANDTKLCKSSINHKLFKIKQGDYKKSLELKNKIVSNNNNLFKLIYNMVTFLMNDYEHIKSLNNKLNQVMRYLNLKCNSNKKLSVPSRNMKDSIINMKNVEEKRPAKKSAIAKEDEAIQLHADNNHSYNVMRAEKIFEVFINDFRDNLADVYKRKSEEFINKQENVELQKDKEELKAKAKEGMQQWDKELDIKKINNDYNNIFNNYIIQKEYLDLIRPQTDVLLKGLLKTFILGKSRYMNYVKNLEANDIDNKL